MRLPPAGWTSMQAQALTVADAEADARRTCRSPVRRTPSALADQTTILPDGVSTNEPGHG